MRVSLIAGSIALALPLFVAAPAPAEPPEYALRTERATLHREGPAWFERVAVVRPVDGRAALRFPADGGEGLPVIDIGGSDVRLDEARGAAPGPATTSEVAATDGRPAVGTIRLALSGSGCAGSVSVTLKQFKSGLSWIPQYRLVTDAGGHPTLRLEAAVVNDAEDLADVECRFADAIVPPYPGLPDPLVGRGGPAATSPDDGRMRQRGPRYERGNPAPAGPTGPPPVRRLTLGRGERVLVTLFESPVAFRRTAAWDAGSSDGARDRSFEREMQDRSEGSAVRSELSLENLSDRFWPAAPAILTDATGRVRSFEVRAVAPGGTAPVDIGHGPAWAVSVVERELEREKHLEIRRQYYDRVAVEGVLELGNPDAEPADVTVRRRCDGTVESTDPAASVAVTGRDQSDNPAARLEWKVRVEPGATVRLLYRYRSLRPPN